MTVVVIEPDGIIYIYTLEDLNNVRNKLYGHYVLMNDIDASDTRDWDGGKGFQPIGDDEAPQNRITGTFDGGGHVIDGLYISRSAQSRAGLFGAVGALVGESRDGLIERSYSTGQVKGDSRVGGLVGYNHAMYLSGLIGVIK